MADESYATHKCFVLSPEGYEEITYDALCRRRESDPSYAQRKFIPLHGMLMEVTPEEYADFYRNQNRQAYLDRRSAAHGDISANDGFLISQDISIEDQIIRRAVLGKLRQALSTLAPEELRLLGDLFADGLTEREVASKYGVSQQALHMRKQRILKKVKKFLEK